MSAAATTPAALPSPAPAPTPAPSRPAQDFGDWLSPMLVKELRQGMRSRVFVISFLLLQLAMVLLAIVGLTAAAFEQSAEVVTGFFWGLVSIPLLLVMPVTGLNSIGGESNADTLELIFLTKLSARRIIFGKWVALVAQSILLVAAVLPYAVLRYFLGSTDVMFEVTVLGIMTLASAVLTAVAVGLSPLPNKVMRIILILVFIGAVMNLGGGVLLLLFSPIGMFLGITSMTPTWWDFIPWCLGAVGVTVFMLEVGAAKLGPAAENHSTALRLIGLSLGIIALLCQVVVTHSFATIPLISVAITLQAIAVFAGLCENPERPFSLYRPFVRLRFLGQFAGRILYPGWPAAVLYTILLALLWLGGARLAARWDADDFRSLVVIVMLAVGTCLFPAAILHTFFPRARLPFLWFLVIYASGAFAQAMVSAIWEYKKFDLRPIVHLIPSCGLATAITDFSSYHGTLLTGTLAGSLIVTVLSIPLLLWSMRGPWATLRAAEAQVAEWMKSGK